ncbi:MAG: hypothetical protein L6R36_009221 [Xanthoria steineri]|nr:MAG: hypothetical protein L6R36_009221 [Xanthoria steineri]
MNTILYVSRIGCFLFYSLLGFYICVHAAGPAAQFRSGLNLPTLSRDWFPSNSPARPWNDYVCRNIAIQNVHLTFEYGDSLPAGRLQQLIINARNDVRETIAFNPNDKLRRGIMSVWEAKESEEIIEPGDVIMAAMAARKRTILPAWQDFFFVDVLKAVNLIEWCSIAHGHIEGIWAYVYVRGVHVGYIWTMRYVPWGPDLQNTTVEM